MGLLKTLFGVRKPEEKTVSVETRRSPAKKHDWFDPNALAAPNLTHYAGDAMSYFRELFYREFPEYEIRENVHASEFVQDVYEKAMPVNFLFCRDGRGVLAILLLRGSQCGRKFEVETEKALQAAGVPCLRYLTDMPNYDFYVINRTREALEGGR